MSDDEWNPSVDLAEAGASPGNIGPLSLDAEGCFDYEPRSPAGIQLKLKAMPEQVCLNSDLVAQELVGLRFANIAIWWQGLAFQVWPSALTLSHYAERQHAQQRWCWQGKHVVELGAGCGLVGLVFASLGAHLLLTDLPHVMALLNSNISQNTPLIEAGGGSAQAAVLSWGLTLPVDLPGDFRQPDIIIAADVVYHREIFEPLMSTLSAFAHCGSNVSILLAHVRRWKSDKHFWRLARKVFDITDVTGHDASGHARVDSRTKGAMRMFRLELKQDAKLLKV